MNQLYSLEKAILNLLCENGLKPQKLWKVIRPASNHGLFYKVIFSEVLTQIKGDLRLIKGKTYFIKYTDTIENEEKGNVLLKDFGYNVVGSILLKNNFTKLLLSEYIEQVTYQQKFIFFDNFPNDLNANSFLDSLSLTYSQLAEAGVHSSTKASNSPIKYSPIKSLFNARINENGRISSWYINKEINIKGFNLTFEKIKNYTWIINGVHYPLALAELIYTSREVLNNISDSVLIAGHGDPHLWNIFVPGYKKMIIFFLILKTQGFITLTWKCLKLI